MTRKTRAGAAPAVTEEKKEDEKQSNHVQRKLTERKKGVLTRKRLPISF